MDGLLGRETVLSLRFERKVDHHDGVLLDDPDEENDADECDDAEVSLANPESEQCAHSSRRQRRNDRHRVDVALVEHSEDDVDGDDGSQNQQWLAG